jgi:Fur family ferric uptake transcriptional regulator
VTDRPSGRIVESTWSLIANLFALSISTSNLSTVFTDILEKKKFRCYVALQIEFKLSDDTKKMKRKTSQRNAIQQVFRKTDCPLGAEEVLGAARQIVDSLNPSTVYRNLKILVETGWLRKIRHPDLGTLYESADKGHHHLFHCRSCNKVFDLPGCALNEEKSTPPGFVSERHEVFLFGVCASCEAENGQSRYVDPPA